jgi:putative transposase
LATSGDFNLAIDTTIGLYKSELIASRTTWGTAGQVEHETLTYIHWYNERRLHGSCDYVPPAEFESTYYRLHGDTSAPADFQ